MGEEFTEEPPNPSETTAAQGSSRVVLREPCVLLGITQVSFMQTHPRYSLSAHKYLILEAGQVPIFGDAPSLMIGAGEDRRHTLSGTHTLTL